MWASVYVYSPGLAFLFSRSHAPRSLIVWPTKSCHSYIAVCCFYVYLRTQNTSQEIFVSRFFLLLRFMFVLPLLMLILLATAEIVLHILNKVEKVSSLRFLFRASVPLLTNTQHRIYIYVYIIILKQMCIYFSWQLILPVEQTFSFLSLAVDAEMKALASDICVYICVLVVLRFAFPYWNRNDTSKKPREKERERKNHSNNNELAYRVLLAPRHTHTHIQQ